MVELGSFYEKVEKVKADVAAILKFFLPIPQIEAEHHDAAPVVPIGGSRGIDACQRFLLAHSVLPAWGEPARPGFPPEGETGKGEIQIPCCRRQIHAALPIGGRGVPRFRGACGGS